MLKILIFIFLILTAGASAQTDIYNRFMLANSYEQAGEFERAKEILEEIYPKQPENFQFFEALNRVYLQLKNYAASEKLIKDRISVNPQDVNLYGLLGKTYYTKGDEEQAFEAWDAAIEKSNGNLAVYRLVANYAIDRRAFNKAIEILNEAKDKSPDKYSFSYDLANLYAVTMNYRSAAEEMVSVLKYAPNEAQNVKARMNNFLNKPEALEQTIKVFENERNSNAEVKSLLAWLYTEKRNFESAYEIYKSLDNERGSGGADIYNFAQLLYNMKEYETASKVYLDIINNYPSAPLINAAKMGYARSVEEILDREIYKTVNAWKPIKPSEEIKSEEADKLIEIYLDLSRKPVHQDLTNEALFRAAMIFINYKNQPEKAEEILKKILEYPVSLYAAPASSEIGIILLKRGELDKAQEYFQKTIGFPRATEEQKNRAKLFISRVHFFKKDFDLSQKILSQIMNDLKDNSANDAIELSLLLNRKMNDSLSLVTFADAEFLIMQGKFNDAAGKLSSISEEKGGFVVGSLAGLRQAELELAMNNTENAIKILEKIFTEGSRNIYPDKALYLLGNIFEFTQNNPQKAKEIYEKLLARFPSSMYLDEAREHLINLKDKLS